MNTAINYQTRIAQNYHMNMTGGDSEFGPVTAKITEHDQRMNDIESIWNVSK